MLKSVKLEASEMSISNDEAAVLGDAGMEEEHYHFNPDELDEKAVLGDDDAPPEKNGTRSNIKAEINGENEAVETTETDLYDDALDVALESLASGAQNTDVSAASGKKLESVEVQSSLPASSPFQQLEQKPTFQNSSFNTSTGNLSTTSNSGRRYCCYIGNLTWWTNDAELQKAIEDCGIFDIVDVKFYENRANGQSKGYALGVFASEASVKNLMERLPKLKLHNQTPSVLPYTKQSQMKLEETARRNDPRATSADNEKNGSTTGSVGMVSSAGMKPSGGSQENLSAPGTKSGLPYIGTIRIGTVGTTTQMQPIGLNQITAIPPRPIPTSSSGGGPAPGQQQSVPSSAASIGGGPGAPQMGQQPPTNLVLSFGQPGGIRPTAGGQMTSVAPITMIQQALQPMIRPTAVAPGINMAPGTAPGAGLAQQIVGLSANQMQQMNRPPPNFGAGMAMALPAHLQQQGAQQAPGGAALNTSAPPPGMGGKPMGGGGIGLPPNFPPPGAHINPQMYPGFAQGFGHGAGHDNGAISEAEFEEIMNRNRTVSSSAITRAVSDASNGDYNSAIETLLTAISLIRQSRVAHDDRCKMLVTSLQDTLNGIENKSYGHKSRSRRDRDRSRSEERGRKRHRRSRSRSRSPRGGGGGYGGGGDIYGYRSRY